MAISSDKQPSIDHQLLRLPEDKTLEEATLEKEECFATLQRYRYNLYQLNRNRGVYDGIVSFLEVEQLLRSNAQKEVELKQILGKQSFIWNMLNTMALERLKKRNWSLHRDWWYWSGYIVGRSGLLKRAFELWRSHPMWYMHPALVEDCIGRGDVAVVHVDAALALSVQTVPLGNLELDIALWIAGAVRAIENSS